jgi:hypothetical protein
MYHDKDNIIFWPNVTICQYSNAVTAFLQSQKIKFVKKRLMYRARERTSKFVRVRK